MSEVGAGRGVIFLDRDGVLNEMVIDAEQGTIDSPLHPDQVRVFAHVPEALKTLTELGFDLVVVTNQPSAAKGKTTIENLRRVHELVLRQAQAGGTRIAGSEICFHREEDRCSCRKPKPGMLEAAWSKLPGRSREASWMAGDGITDVQAGRAFGEDRVFGPEENRSGHVLGDHAAEPTLWCRDLAEFAGKMREN